MKRPIFKGLFFTLLIGAIWGNYTFAQASEAAIAATVNNGFGIELFQKVIQTNQGKNVFLSPFSISSALAMTYAGARGNTAKQIAHTLHYGDALDVIHTAFQSVTQALQSSGRKGCHLYVANALWGQKDYSLQNAFFELIDRYYAGGFNMVDYIGQTEKSRKCINQWIMAHTADKIKELLAKGDVDMDTRLVLTNAIYFKGDWAQRFAEGKTRNSPFQLASGQSVQVPMMLNTGVFSYAEPNSNLQVLELPYEGDAYAMLVLLPRKDLRTIENKLTPKTLADWLSALHKAEVELFFPRFKFQSKYYLKSILKTMGMHDAFGELADFSAMTGHKDLYIGKVIHQADIEVNEEGTEAAAATAVVMQRKSMVMRTVFKADHPFIFLIRHKPTNTIVFMGKVMHPTGV